MAMERDFELIFKNDDGEIIALYPRTLAKQVLLGNGYTAEDHANSDLHLFGQEVSALANFNAANGYLKLNEDGYIPEDLIDESIYLIRREFNTVTEMLNSTTVEKGSLVMVLDASDDPTVNSNWAIYRKKLVANNYTVLTGWEKVAEKESVDISLAWIDMENHPNSTPEAIDTMVNNNHTHPNLSVQEDFNQDLDGRPTFKTKRIAYDEELVRIYATDYYDPDEARDHSFWLKPLHAQSWWSSNAVTDAGTTLYERFADQNSLTTTPRLLTHDVTTVNRMCYSCDALQEVPQYDYYNCVDFTSQFEDCIHLTTVPIMNSKSGKYFDKQFKGCVRLEEAPSMILNEAISVSEQYSGCVNLLHIPDFGSTSKVTTMAGWFNGDTSLQVILGEIDFSSITQDSAVLNMFNGCDDLEKVKFKAGTLKVALDLSNTNLTPSTLTDILEGLPTIEIEKDLNLTGVVAAQSIDSDLITATIQKGWNIIID